MAKSKTSRAIAEQRLAQLLQADPPDSVITEAIAIRLRTALATPVSDRLWRDLLRSSGYPLAPLVEGVRQDNFVHLERTLLALWQQWREADPISRRGIRRTVIVAKDHAKWAAANPNVAPSKRTIKQEMALWMLTWLENPDVFEPWVALRKLQLLNQPRTPTAAVRSTPPQ